MTTEPAWRQRAEGRELCECGDWDEDHKDKCRVTSRPLEQCQLNTAPHLEREIARQVLCPAGSGEFRRARRPE